jgi:hypothetical protein
LEPLHLDDACWVILRSLTDAPKTPQMISRIHGIPIVDGWKRVRFLEGLGLVHVVLTFLTREGQVLYFYQRSNEALTVVFEDRPRLYFQPAW